MPKVTFAIEWTLKDGIKQTVGLFDSKLEAQNWAFRYELKAIKGLLPRLVGATYRIIKTNAS